MSLRTAFTSRWFTPSSGLAQQLHVSPSSILRKNLSSSQTVHLTNSLASTPFRRAFSTQKNPFQNHFFTSRNTFRNNILNRNLPNQRRPVFRRFFNSSRPNQQSAGQPKQSLTQRLKALSKEYGWAALGVYLLLSAMDFPFCFIAVRHLGAERIGRYEQAVVDKVTGLFGAKPSHDDEGQVEGSNAQSDGQAVAMKEAPKKNNLENASLWTTLVVAYAVHKSLIFIRVPLTAAITPKVVKVLRVWGWDLAKRRPRGPGGM